MNYYNEFNPESAAMLRQLMADGIIPKGHIDERSITEVLPDDLREYTQCHFFAGIGGWSIALGLAGWPEDRPVWTGSCPCQPFSSAGGQKGKTDDRHLWPVWQRLITECHPASVYGEQVSSAIAHGWLDDVYQGMEPEGYAIGSAVLPACSVGAPHKRDRLWFVAHADQSFGRIGNQQSTGEFPQLQQNDRTGTCSTVAHAAGGDILRRSGLIGAVPGRSTGHHGDELGQSGERRDGFMADTGGGRLRRSEERKIEQSRGAETLRTSVVADTESFGRRQIMSDNRWSAEGNNPRQGAGSFDNGRWIDCPDGKARLVEPGISLLADGFQHRRPILHAIGNAIVPQVAAAFIQASM